MVSASRAPSGAFRRASGGGEQRGGKKEDHRAIGHERAPVVDAAGKDRIEKGGRDPRRGIGEEPAREEPTVAIVRGEREGNETAEYLVDAERFVERGGQEGDDLQFELDVVRRRPVIRRLGNMTLN